MRLLQCFGRDADSGAPECMLSSLAYFSPPSRGSRPWLLTPAPTGALEGCRHSSLDGMRLLQCFGRDADSGAPECMLSSLAYFSSPLCAALPPHMSQPSSPGSPVSTQYRLPVLVET